MSGEFIDVSIPLRDGMVSWPGDAPFSRLQTLHIANGDICNLSQISTSAHIGTHMDAPRHFLADGKGMETMPIEATIGRARVIAIQHPDLIECRSWSPTISKKASGCFSKLKTPSTTGKPTPSRKSSYTSPNRPPSTWLRVLFRPWAWTTFR